MTIVLATLSWYLVERPTMRFRNRHIGLFAGGLWVIVLASFVGRLWSIGTATARNPGNGDPFYYHAQANMLADGVGFGEPHPVAHPGPLRPDGHPPAVVHPLADPVIAAGCLEASSPHKTMAVFAGLAVVVVAAFLTRRLTGSDRAGLVAGALVAL